jgi:hypothetical protein
MNLYSIMDFFSGSNPNLISGKTVKSIDRTYNLRMSGPQKETKFISNIYNSYIAPYFISIFVVLVLVLFLTYRYYVKKSREEEEKNNPVEELTETESEFEENNKIIIRKTNKPLFDEIKGTSIQELVDNDNQANYEQYDADNQTLSNYNYQQQLFQNNLGHYDLPIYEDSDNKRRQLDEMARVIFNEESNQINPNMNINY